MEVIAKHGTPSSGSKPPWKTFEPPQRKPRHVLLPPIDNDVYCVDAIGDDIVIRVKLPPKSPDGEARLVELWKFQHYFQPHPFSLPVRYGWTLTIEVPCPYDYIVIMKKGQYTIRLHFHVDSPRGEVCEVAVAVS